MPPAPMRHGISFDGTVYYEPMNRISYSIDLIEQRGQLALQDFQPLIRRRDDAKFALAFSDLKLSVHLVTIPPNFLELLGT